MDRPVDHYALLGVTRDASPDTIRAAYVARAKAYHPDFAKTADAFDRFHEVRLAYDCLRSPESRARYDRETAAYADLQYRRIDRAQRRLRRLDRRAPMVVAAPRPVVPHWRAAAVVAASGSLVLSVCYLMLR